MGTESVEAVQYDDWIEENGWNEVRRREGGHGDSRMGLRASKARISLTIY